eukprot:TRINITY_DN6485_c0_g1_i4.p1 TRINITY_DN6485_c0_g1~~TRINITY_DN6485_c0_g1_i4.p1  ORF type:complete len:467 (-),score=101.35 TRINITY_DN6485_c0_g1_i4:271-1581(-)
MTTLSRVSWIRMQIAESRAVSFHCSYNVTKCTHKVTVRLHQQMLTAPNSMAEEFFANLAGLVDSGDYISSDKGHCHSSGCSVIVVYLQARPKGSDRETTSDSDKKHSGFSWNTTAAEFDPEARADRSQGPLRPQGAYTLRKPSLADVGLQSHEHVPPGSASSWDAKQGHGGVSAKQGPLAAGTGPVLPLAGRAGGLQAGVTTDFHEDQEEYEERIAALERELEQELARAKALQDKALRPVQERTQQQLRPPKSILRKAPKEEKRVVVKRQGAVTKDKLINDAAEALINDAAVALQDAITKDKLISDAAEALINDAAEALQDAVTKDELINDALAQVGKLELKKYSFRRMMMVEENQNEDTEDTEPELTKSGLMEIREAEFRKLRELLCESEFSDEQIEQMIDDDYCTNVRRAHLRLPVTVENMADFQEEDTLSSAS